MKIILPIIIIAVVVGMVVVVLWTRRTSPKETTGSLISFLFSISTLYIFAS